MKFVVVCFCSMLLGAFIARAIDDVSGKWIAEIQGGDEKHIITFDLKADGNKITGSEGRTNGAVQIRDGSVTDDVITFTVTRNIGDRTLVLDYTGKISTGKIDFTVKPRGNGWTSRFTATRQN
jgi:hypothetical protein